MGDLRIQCPVVDKVTAMPTKEVNAFRIVPDAGKSFFLDFLHFSPALQRAEVVSRLRVYEDALESLRDRLSRDVVIEIYDGGHIIVWPNNRMVN